MPDSVLFRHWIERVRGATASLYGRRVYGLMRYWEEDQPGWSPDERDFAAAWRAQPKWVVSGSLTTMGPNATLVSGEVEAELRRLKAELAGEVDVAGPELAAGLSELGLVDEYRLYFHPVVLGRGVPFFAGVRPQLRLVDSARIGEGVVQLTYVPA